MISDKEMRKRIADMSPEELLKASETFEALFDLVHQHDDNSIENTNPDYYKQELARRDEERNALADENRMLSERIQRLVEGVKSRDEIIARLKEDAERLADGMIISPENEGDFCSYCGGMEHVDDCPITLHRALMKELAEC